MAVETMKKRSCNVVLENGRDSDGTLKTVTQGIGTLSKVASNWDGDKAIAIGQALGPCLSKTINSMTTTVENTLSVQ